MSNIDEREHARFYTRSRRFPKLIGRMHDGTKIPGGPYTVAQFVIAALVVAIAVMTRTQWGTGVILVDIPIAIVIGAGAAWGAGHIPATRRNLLSIILGAGSAVLRPADGHYRDRPFRINRPHRAGGSSTIATRSFVPAPVVITPAPVAVVNAAPSTSAFELEQPAAAKSATAVTAVERLLQQSRT